MPVSTSQLTNLPNLGPGSRGNSVRTLQQWLVENDFMTQAQMNTGPGIYGPRTKAAVAAWQSKAGFDTQGNPGFFGPISKQYLSKTAEGKPPENRVVSIPFGTGKAEINTRGDIVRQVPADTSLTPTPTPEPEPEPDKDEVEVEAEPTPDVTTPPVDKDFQNTDAYKALSDEEKETADLLFNVISVGGEAEARTFADAIQQSIAVAEPWAKAQAAMALAEFAGAVDETIFGFEAKAEAIKRSRDILAEDVTNQKEFLTLEQQSEIARQVKQYDQDLLTIADQAAEKGITFATGARSRQLAETRRTEQFQDVIESSRRKTNFQIKELELKAARGDVDAQKQLETLSGEQGFALRKIGRSAEEILGSERARELGITGFKPTGGVEGTLEEEKEKRIISDVGGVVGLTDSLTNLNT